MRRFRRRLARLVGPWLLLHALMLSAAPTILCVENRAAESSSSCTCADGDQQQCPMHHPVQKRASESCSCRGTTDPSAEIAATLFGPSAIMPPSLVAFRPARTSDVVTQSATNVLDTSLIPNAPPPRS
jgi:hypothetical protein